MSVVCGFFGFRRRKRHTALSLCVVCVGVCLLTVVICRSKQHWEFEIREILRSSPSVSPRSYCSLLDHVAVVSLIPCRRPHAKR